MTKLKENAAAALEAKVCLVDDDNDYVVVIVYTELIYRSGSYSMISVMDDRLKRTPLK